MSKLKTYCYSTFSNNLKNSTKTDLVIDNSKNIVINKYEIASWGTFNNALINYIDESLYDSLVQNYSNIIDNIYQIIPYDYFDDTQLTFGRRLFILTIDYKLYEIINNDLNFIYFFSDEYPKIIFNKNDLYLLKNTGDYLLFETNSASTIGSTLPNIKFCYSGEYILFSSESNPFNIYYTNKIAIKDISRNITQYDKISIPYNSGMVLDIIHAYNKTFVICKYSIHKIDSSTLTISQSLETSFEIYKNTISKCDDYIIFYSSCGIMRFDGNNINLLLNNDMINLKNAKSVIFDNKYYLFSCNSKDCLFELNLNEDSINCLYFNKIKNVYKLSNTQNHCLNINIQNEDNIYKNITIEKHNLIPIESCFTFHLINFDTIDQKQIKSLKLELEGELTIEIISDCARYCAKCCDNELLNNINIMGSYFIISMKSDSEFKLHSIMFNVLHLED